MSRIRLVLVDDHPPLRAGVAAILDRSQRYRVVGEAGSVADALEAVRSHGPQMVIVDVSLPDGNGLDLVRSLKRADSSIRVLVLTMHARRALADSAFAAGASGYLLKESAAEDLVRALDAVAAGESYLDPKLAPADGELRVPLDGTDTLQRLSDRELEVFRLLACGQNSKQIGAALGISPKTVDNHRSSIMDKLELDSIAGLVRLAIRAGAIDP